MTSSRPLDVSLAISFVLALAAFYGFRRSHKPRRVPPGPAPLPVLGNVKDMDPNRPFLKFLQLGKQFDSPVVYLKVLGQEMIIINEYGAARDILGKRGLRNGSRPPMTMAREFVGQWWNFSTLPIGPTWKACRKEADLVLRPSNPGSKDFRELEVTKMDDILERLRKTPNEFVQHIRFFTVSLMLEIAYGVVITDSHDPYIATVEGAMDGFNAQTDYPLVDMFPWLRYFPSWLPGMDWKTRSIQWRQDNSDTRELPFAKAQAAFHNQAESVSVAAKFLNRRSNGELLSEDMIKDVTATLIAGGTDTVTAMLLAFFMFMKTFPEIQKRAQSHIDDVLGYGRLPTFDDRGSLPYIEALMYEVLRLGAPVGTAPHLASEDDIWQHNGETYLIPKGSFILPNMWAMSRDPNMYDDPERFNPSRFLAKDGSLNRNSNFPDMIYGFWPRFCPGKYMAEDVLFIFMATVLATFTIGPKDGDKDGVESNVPDLEQLWKPGFIRYPKDFTCDIIPRSM
ncbi:cytochrome P450 [Flagelloscypha sp. PMI_526]|nr:cytochrome P450 [Flagelloscypha sp. PMI_526]